MIVDILMAGFSALKDYIALHVLTCLIPAFLLAGGIVTFVSRESIIGYIGAAAKKISSASRGQPALANTDNLETKAAL